MSTGPCTSESSVVPETLLAFAKDQRYINQVKDLLEQVLRIENNQELLELSAACLSSVLYGLLLLVRIKRTAGMAATGVEFESTVSRWRLLWSILASTGWVFGVQYLCRNRNHATCERLTGADRVRVFEEQRRRMMERSLSMVQQQSNSSVNRIPTRNIPWKRYLRWLLPALTAEPEGPHQIPTTNANEQSNNVLIWMLRLHLALYCINGRYASLIHRLIVRRPIRATSNRTPLVNRPETIRGIGALVFTQAVVTLLQALSRKWVHRSADRQVEGMLGRPSDFHIEGIPASPVEDETVLCAICRRARKYPACPNRCGHVFCWHCLQQWVTLNVEACPLCREPCRKQDIVFLRNYVGEPS